ncbi:386_t:CDS:2 [Dentiscutata erythropus]|uniref:386_t:CDS:1 n=1 Tax=Dentiscutata erythropus TaxID=1348616 RepID=A0A9N9F7V6_9GLOM|nr:386_t:CDS:2 [Dentiscutata erythropus]
MSSLWDDLLDGSNDDLLDGSENDLWDGSEDDLWDGSEDDLWDSSEDDSWDEIRQILLKLQEKYGSVFELYLGVNRKIIIRDPKLLDEIYNKSLSSVFQKRIIPGAVSLGLDEKNKNIFDKEEKNDDDDVLTILVDEDIKNKSCNVMEIDDMKINNKNIISLLNEMINGGVITTVNSIKFLIYQIYKHSEVREKVYDEIKNIFENESHLTNYDDVNKLTYIDTCKEEQEFIIHHNYIYLNEKYWNDPKSFIPERFIDVNNIVKNSYKLFGNGVKECPGKYLLSK